MKTERKVTGAREGARAAPNLCIHKTFDENAGFIKEFSATRLGARLKPTDEAKGAHCVDTCFGKFYMLPSLKGMTQEFSEENLRIGRRFFPPVIRALGGYLLNGMR